MHGGRPAFRVTVEDSAKVDATPRVRIVGPNGQFIIVTADGGLVKLADAFLNKALLKHDALQSKYVFASRSLTGLSGEPLLVVFGWAFASDPGSIRVIGLNPAGDPVLLLSDDTFELTGIRTGKDKSVQLIGRPSLSEQLGNCSITYDPYAVYQLSPSNPAGFKYSVALSKAYNLNHYYGWAGPTYREDVIIDLCGKTGPRIVSARKSHP